MYAKIETAGMQEFLTIHQSVMSRSNQQGCTNIVHDLDTAALCEGKPGLWELEMPDVNELSRNEGEAGKYELSDALKSSH